MALKEEDLVLAKIETESSNESWSPLEAIKSSDIVKSHVQLLAKLRELDILENTELSFLVECLIIVWKNFTCLDVSPRMLDKALLQIQFVGFQLLRSGEHMAVVGVSFFLQVYLFDWVTHLLNDAMQFQAFLRITIGIGVVALGVATLSSYIFLWVRIPYLLQWGPPIFDTGHCFRMMAVALVSLIELTRTYKDTSCLASVTPSPIHVLPCGIR